MIKDKINSIQILRGLAVLSVVLFHFRVYLVPDDADRSIPDKIFGWGAIGVDLFFVISGFIMVYVTCNKPAGLKTSLQFIVNRLTRILPTYYIILLFAFLTSGAMSIFHYPDKLANLISAFTFQPYLSQPAPLYIADSGMYNIRWTLNYELYFYLAFAVCLLIKPRLLALTIWFIAPVLIAFSLTSTFTLSTEGYNFNSVISRFLTNPILLEFGLGVLAGHTYFYLKNREINFSRYLPFLCLTIIAIAIALGYLKPYSVFSAVAFFFLVLFYALQNRCILKYTPQFLVTLGNMSFSLYLVHNPLAGFITGKVEKMQPGAMHTLPGYFSLLIASLVLAALSHKYLEIKLTDKIRSLTRKRVSPGQPV
ncbi:acyltransferase family protein [Kosakonia cowanii]|jgi:peptidoglycan/LPS O-acetylase OafA/YrhL|uniref:acyltransferase family protein n=1 Tax=Kosakonia cowanii TaxID=208223 RepID=UPI002897526E|nr:acyltransferase [Kosakonia cowanii]